MRDKTRMATGLLGAFGGIAGRTVILVMGALVSFMVVLIFLLSAGTARILSAWKADETKILYEYVETELADLLAGGSEPSEESVAKAMKNLPIDPSWLAVADSRGRTLYAYSSVMMMPGASDKDNMRMQRMMSNRKRASELVNANWVEVGGGELRFSASLPEFGQRESNRLLMGAARHILAWGLLFASIVSLAFAFAFAWPLTRQSTALARSLSLIAEGKRDVPIPHCPVAEFSRIAGAAAILQENLTREEGIRRQWAADVAHDLRTPLAVLRGQVDGMIDGVFAADVPRLARLAGEIARLDRLVKSLSLLSRIETPGFTPNRRVIALGPFLGEIAERFGAEAESGGASIETASNGLSIEADEELLDRAVSNLVSNATRYGEPGGTISLVAREEDETADGPGSVAISVENPGTIPEEIIPKIFDRLYRGDGARSSDGSGLGLAIAKAIAEAHGGKIAAKSDPSRNQTLFTLTLPAR